MRGSHARVHPKFTERLKPKARFDRTMVDLGWKADFAYCLDVACRQATLSVRRTWLDKKVSEFLLRLCSNPLATSMWFRKMNGTLPARSCSWRKGPDESQGSPGRQA